ncbi:MAG: hypothetical protein EOM45_09805 [Clostridia bacterium]|nr:hypothetical protein [Clostridia bacterium]
MKNPKTGRTAWKFGALLVTSSLCISTLGISYSYFGESLESKAVLTVAEMDVVSDESGKIEYDYDQKVLKVTFYLKNTGDLPVKLSIKDAKALYNSFSDSSQQRIFMEYDDEIFEDIILEPDEMEQEFTMEFKNVHVEAEEYGYFDTEIELEYAYSETESWKDAVEIEAVDENRQLQAERYLAYLTALEAQAAQAAAQQIQPEIPVQPVPEGPSAGEEPSQPDEPAQDNQGSAQGQDSVESDVPEQTESPDSAETEAAEQSEASEPEAVTEPAEASDGDDAPAESASYENSYAPDSAPEEAASEVMTS